MNTIKTAVLLSVVAAVQAVVAAGPSVAKLKAGATNDIGRAKLEFYRREGGVIIKNEPDNGLVLIANAQTNLFRGNFYRTMGYLRNVAKMNVDCRDVEARVAQSPSASALKDLKAVVAVFVVYDPSSRTPFLVSPDEHWAKVNLAALDADKPGKEVFVSRSRMAVLRALLNVCGSGSSRRANTIVGAFKNGVSDYDRFTREDMPLECLQTMQAYLQELGSRTIKQSTYRAACQEGWAPAPENEFQKAIWDEAKKKATEPPTNPIKIKYDPKRGK